MEAVIIMKKRYKALLLALCLGVSATAFAQPAANFKDQLPKYEYKLVDTVEVFGRQGIATDGDYYYVSGSKTLAKYDKNWNLIAKNEKPFEGYAIPANHIGDIDVFNNEIYVSAENFMDGVGKDIQIAVHDANTLKLKRTFKFEPSSGQEECSGITVNPDERTVWMCSWVGEESGRYLYEYSLDTGEYLRKVHLQAVPQWVQGMFYYKGSYYLTADDGTADMKESDHLYRVDIKPGDTRATVVMEKTFDDVIFEGEIEGLTVNPQTKQMLVHFNRGSQIVLGMVKGFYPGYDREISEVYIYDMKEIKY